MPMDERRECILAIIALALEKTLDQLPIRQPPDHTQRVQRPDVPECLIGRISEH
jgi:hypothetical protein